MGICLLLLPLNSSSLHTREAHKRASAFAECLKCDWWLRYILMETPAIGILLAATADETSAGLPICNFPISIPPAAARALERLFI